MPDAFGYGVPQLFTAQRGEIVVGEIFDFQFVGCSFQTVGESGGYDGVRQFPDFSLGILEGSVSVDHHFHMLACGVQDALLNVEHKVLAVPRKEFYAVLAGFVGAEQTIGLVVSAPVHGRGEDVVETEDHPGTCIAEKPLAALAGVDVAGDDGVGVVEYGERPVGKDHLDFSSALAYELHVIVYVIDAGKLVKVHAEQFAVALETEYVGIGIDSYSVDLVKAYEGISYFVRRIGKHENYFPASFRYASQADRETVAAEDGENDTYDTAACFLAHVFGDRIHGCIIPH